MSHQLLFVCLAVGVGTYLFRYLPTRWSRGARPTGPFGGALGGFLGSVGIAAVSALLAASLAPLLGQLTGPGAAVRGVSLVVGLGATAITFGWRRSVALATLAGAAAYGLGFWLLG